MAQSFKVTQIGARKMKTAIGLCLHGETKKKLYNIHYLYFLACLPLNYIELQILSKT